MVGHGKAQHGRAQRNSPAWKWQEHHGALLRGIPAPQVVSLPHSRCFCPAISGFVPQEVALPHKGWLCAIGSSQGNCASDLWLLPRESAGPPQGQRAGSGDPPHPCGHMPSPSSSAVSLFPICWEQVRDQQGVPKSLRPGVVTVPRPRQHPAPWDKSKGHVLGRWQQEDTERLPQSGHRLCHFSL